jgi:hypothetical protein
MDSGTNGCSSKGHGGGVSGRLQSVGIAREGFANASSAERVAAISSGDPCCCGRYHAAWARSVTSSASASTKLPGELAAAEPLLGGRTGGHAASPCIFRAVCCAMRASLTWKAGCEGHAGGNFTLFDGVEGSAENVPRSVLRGWIGAVCRRGNSLEVVLVLWFVLSGSILVSGCFWVYAEGLITSEDCDRRSLRIQAWRASDRMLGAADDVVRVPLFGLTEDDGV